MKEIENHSFKIILEKDEIVNQNTVSCCLTSISNELWINLLFICSKKSGSVNCLSVGVEAA